jgi:hypothetical protein
MIGGFEIDHDHVHEKLEQQGLPFGHMVIHMLMSVSASCSVLLMVHGSIHVLLLMWIHIVFGGSEDADLQGTGCPYARTMSRQFTTSNHVTECKYILMYFVICFCN